MNVTKQSLLRKLGFATYNDYLQSRHWKRIKAKRLTKHTKCEVCGKRKARVLHHLFYQRLGQERKTDLLAACVECHNVIHTELDQRYYGRTPEYKAARTMVAVRAIRMERKRMKKEKDP